MALSIPSKGLAQRMPAPSIGEPFSSNSPPPWPCCLPSRPRSACSPWNCASKTAPPYHATASSPLHRRGLGSPSLAPRLCRIAMAFSALRSDTPFGSQPHVRFGRLAFLAFRRALHSLVDYRRSVAAFYTGPLLAIFHLCPCRPGSLRRRARIPSVQARVNLIILFAAPLQLAVNSMFTHRAGGAVHAGCNAVARHRGADSRSLQAY